MKRKSRRRQSAVSTPLTGTLLEIWKTKLGTDLPGCPGDCRELVLTQRHMIQIDLKLSSQRDRGVCKEDFCGFRNWRWRPQSWDHTRGPFVTGGMITGDGLQTGWRIRCNSLMKLGIFPVVGFGLCYYRFATHMCTQFMRACLLHLRPAFCACTLLAHAPSADVPNLKNMPKWDGIEPGHPRFPLPIQLNRLNTTSDSSMIWGKYRHELR